MSTHGVTMSKTRKRQSLAGQRLKKEFPDIHVQLVTGRIPSLKKALVKAGIETKATPVEKMLKGEGFHQRALNIIASLEEAVVWQLTVRLRPLFSTLALNVRFSRSRVSN